MSGIKTEEILLSVKDEGGATSEMRVYVAHPKREGKLPAIMVLQEAFGVNGHIEEVVKKFAAAGFIAAAPELYHRTAPRGFVCPYGDFAAVMPHMQAVKVEGLRADLQALHGWSQVQENVAKERIAAVGYCMGGRVAYIANAHLPLKAAISFYGGRIVPDLLPLAAQQHGPIMLGWGGRDQHIGTAQSRPIADALKAAGKTYIDVEFSDADHGFLCDERPSYHPISAKIAWAMKFEFLAQYL